MHLHHWQPVSSMPLPDASQQPFNNNFIHPDFKKAPFATLHRLFPEFNFMSNFFQIFQNFDMSQCTWDLHLNFAVFKLWGKDQLYQAVSCVTFRQLKGIFPRPANYLAKENSIRIYFYFSQIKQNKQKVLKEIKWANTSVWWVINYLPCHLNCKKSKLYNK